MKKLLLIVPSRKRTHRIIPFYECFKKSSTIAELCIGLDEDDEHNYPRFDGVIYDINPNMGLNDKLNLLAYKYCDQYEYIGFMGDDHLIRTEDWDQKFLKAVEDVKYGVVYGNDLIQGARLPTAVVMSSSIIQKLGYMSPPKLKHFYLDNFWKDLGEKLNSLRYLDDVIIEHMHFCVNKAAKDEINEKIYTDEVLANDKFLYYQEYLKNEFHTDLEKLK